MLCNASSVQFGVNAALSRQRSPVQVRHGALDVRYANGERSVLGTDVCEFESHSHNFLKRRFCLSKKYLPCECDGCMTVFETVRRGSIPRWGTDGGLKKGESDRGSRCKCLLSRGFKRCFVGSPEPCKALTVHRHKWLSTQACSRSQCLKSVL